MNDAVRHRLDPSALGELTDIVGPTGLVTDPDVLAGAARDWTGRWVGHAPALVRPGTVGEVAGVVAWARRHHVALVPQGGNTGLVAGGIPHAGEIVLSMERFSRPPEVDDLTGQARVAAGTPVETLQQAARAAGWEYGVDLASRGSATLGGTIATNASGSRSFRYGSTRRWVESLRVVLADGSVREFVRGEAIDFDPPVIPLPQVTKNTAGYLLRPGMDWVDLFCGSEGTLGVVTEARVRLLPAPKAVLGGVVFFPDDDAALTAVEVWRDARMLEYFDIHSLRLMRPRFPETPANAAATPPAPPAMIIEARSSTFNALCHTAIIAAASCTVGPSRPVEPPTSRLPKVTSAVITAVLTEIRLRVAPSGSALAAITCGMPEPRASGAVRRVIHTSNAKPIGVSTSGQ